MFRELVHVSVRASVVGLPRIAEHRRNRGEQHDEVQRTMPGRLIQCMEFSYLGSEYRAHLIGRLVGDIRIANDAGTVNDARQWAALALNDLYTVANLIHPTHITREISDINAA